MRVFSFIREGIDLKPVEVEVSLMPGLPQFHVTGLADQAIKESLQRVRAAIKAAKFELPTRLKVFFNLKPAYTRKKSDGLDLAFAVAYLLATKQIHIDLPKDSRLYVYGELGLNGEVLVSDEVELMPRHLGEGAQLLVGTGRGINLPCARISSLAEIENPLCQADSPSGLRPLPRPPAEDLYFDQDSARLLTIVAAGEHSILLAGPAGAGKSTLVSAAHQALRELTPEEHMEVARIAKVCAQPVEWRPLVSPHHTIPVISMVGGGTPPQPGEITRAHKGVLVMDEFLEFHPNVREALREPIESRQITVSRCGRVQRFPADFLLFATTNLCPCGDFTPGTGRICGYSAQRCRSYLEKLTGPLLDRFEILCLYQRAARLGQVSLAQIREDVGRAQAFARRARSQLKVNSRLTDEEAERFLGSVVLREVYGHPTSRRRTKAMIRVARTIADLAEENNISRAHLDEARKLTAFSFEELRKSFL